VGTTDPTAARLLELRQRTQAENAVTLDVLLGLAEVVSALVDRVAPTTDSADTDTTDTTEEA
jgi:hypothetical protein